MNTREYILERQIRWAERRGVRLGGPFRHSSDPDQVERGTRTWVYTLADNLFEPLSPEVREQFVGGDGGELRKSDRRGGNMHALQSSSAIAANVFHYWRRIEFPGPVASACGLPTTRLTSLDFEVKREIREHFARPPNLDVEFQYSAGGPIRAAAVECKFCEPYGARGHSGLASHYLDLEEWDHYPALHALGKTISPDDTTYEHFHVAQILKHVLGLTRAHGAGRFRLLYLWYDAPGRDAAAHRAEVEMLQASARSDGLAFQATTYQDVITKLARAQRREHAAYVDYLT